MAVESGVGESPQRLAPRWAATRDSDRRWVQSTGAQLLVVDPQADRAGLRSDLEARGVHVVWVASTLDGLVEFGRRDPAVIIVAPEAHGAAVADFVKTVKERGHVFVIAALAMAGDPQAGPLLLAGAGAAVTRPYSADTVMQVLECNGRSLDEALRVSFGPIELDVRAYSVAVRGHRIGDLPLKEFEMLRALMCRAPDVMSNEELRASLWPDSDGPSDNAIAVHVGRLRHRLDGVARVRRIRGRGYALTVQ